MDTLEKILSNFATGIHCSIEGRITGIRNHRNVIFFDVENDSQRIQLIDLQSPTERNPVIGDIIKAEGTTVYSNRGEKSIQLKKLTILVKNIADTNLKRGSTLQNTGLRHVDLLVNQDYRLFIRKRFQFMASIREFLYGKEFLEFDTSVLQSHHHSGFSKPFVTKLNSQKKEVYLRGTSEIRLKQLVVGGFNKVFEMGKVFRNEGQDRMHHPEYTQLEAYQAYTTYWDAMSLIEEMLKASTSSSFPENSLLTESRPWPRISLLELGIDVLGKGFSFGIDRNEMIKICSENLGTNQKIDASVSDPQLFLYIIRKLLFPTIQEPSFIYGFPEVISPLAKSSLVIENGCEKAALIVKGRRICDIATEETNYELLRRKLLSQELITGQQPDPDFLHAMECGLPPTSGYSMGIERLSLLLHYGNHERSVKEAILFPL